jgi:hypothetical protein
VADLPAGKEPPQRQRSLRELRPVGLEVIQAGSTPAQRWAYLIDRYHYWGLHVVGENLGYLAYDRNGEEVACLLLGAPAWRCAVRDTYLTVPHSEMRPDRLNRPTCQRVPFLKPYRPGEVQRPRRFSFS